MIDNRIAAVLGAAALAATILIGGGTAAGAAPGAAGVHTSVAAAPSPGQRVNTADLTTQAQAQHALSFSALRNSRLNMRPATPLNSSYPSGSPDHVAMLSDTAVASAINGYAAYLTPRAFTVKQFSWVYTTPTGAAQAMTRHLGYLKTVRPNTLWYGQTGLKVSRVAGVGNDAYWKDVVGPDVSYSALFFRQGNIVTQLTTYDAGKGYAREVPTATVSLARELAAAQRVAHSGSGPTAAVLELGKQPIRIGKF